MKQNLYNWNFSLLFLSLVLLKTIVAWIFPVVGDETYYWVWGQNLQLSYYDHPAGVGLLTWLSAWLQSFIPMISKSVSLRLPFIILSTLTLFIWLKIFLQKNQTASDMKWFVIFYMLNPLLGVGGIFATPDVPLLFFWSLSYYCVLQIIKTQKKTWYILLGVFLGLGFCSKYHIVLFPLTLIISLFFSRQLKQIQIYRLLLTFVFGLTFSLPVLIWNYQNHWVSFLFQINHGLSSKNFEVSWPLGYFMGQILLFNPVLIFVLLKKTKAHFDKNMSLTQWGFFTYSSTKALVEANWPITAHVHGLSAVISRSISYYKSALLYWLVVWTLLIATAFTSFGKNKFNNLPQSVAAKEIYQAVQSYKPLYGPSYQMASLLTFVSGEQIPKLKNLSRFDFYDSLAISQPSRTPFYVLKYISTDWPIDFSNLKQKPVLIKKLDKYKLELYLINNE